MKIKELKKALLGEVGIPGDKSISHRAVILLSIAEGAGRIENILYSEDVERTIEIFKSMGVKIYKQDRYLMVEGKGLDGLEEPVEDLYCGNSGTTIRLLSGLMVGQKFNSRLRGDKSLNKRPMGRIIKPLSLMDGNIEGFENQYPPLSIGKKSKLKGIDYKMEIASAQVKSTIMLAGLYTDEEIIIREIDISRNHTENMLKYLGIDINTEKNLIKIKNNRKLLSRDIFVPSDISSAAYFIVAASIIEGSDLLIRNIGLNNTRDGIIKVLERMNGRIKIINKKVQNNEEFGDISVKYSNLKGTRIDKSEIGKLIDEIPIIAVAASFAKGSTVIENIEELKYKETDRLSAIIKELSKSGVDIYEEDNNLIINGGKNYKGSVFDSYNDHRMAMALSIFALKCQGESKILDSECINISFPDFYEKLNLLIK